MAKELILMSDVPGLGIEGDMVKVAEGYARNYLLPRNLAAPLMLFFMLRWVRSFPGEMPEERRVPGLPKGNLRERVKDDRDVHSAAQHPDDGPILAPYGHADVDGPGIGTIIIVDLADERSALPTVERTLPPFLVSLKVIAGALRHSDVESLAVGDKDLHLFGKRLHKGPEMVADVVAFNLVHERIYAVISVLPGLIQRRDLGLQLSPISTDVGLVGCL